MALGEKTRMNTFITCPNYHLLTTGPSTDRGGITFTCDICSQGHVDVAVGCRLCAYDVCRACYYGARSAEVDLEEGECMV